MGSEVTYGCGCEMCMKNGRKEAIKAARQSARDAVIEAAKGLDLHIERYLTALLVYPTLPPDEKFLVELKWLNASLAALDAAERAGGT